MNLKHRYFIRFAFNGMNYHGWQLQENAQSVQQIIEHALSLIFKQEVQTTGAGRTDTGVHAREFYAHFDLEREIIKMDLVKLVGKLNGFLPYDISIYDIRAVRQDAHARFSALSRTYEYWVCRTKDPFLSDFSHYYYAYLNVDLMNEGANVLSGYEDFSAFSKTGTQTKTNNCNIMHTQWTSKRSLLIFEITADRFLRNMVRAIVGTLLDLGRGHISVSDLREIIEHKNRSEAGMSVPAKGLYLTKVIYSDDIFI